MNDCMLGSSSEQVADTLTAPQAPTALQLISIGDFVQLAGHSVWAIHLLKDLIEALPSEDLTPILLSTGVLEAVVLPCLRAAEKVHSDQIVCAPFVYGILGLLVNVVSLDGAAMAEINAQLRTIEARTLHYIIDQVSATAVPQYSCQQPPIHLVADRGAVP